MNTTSLIRSTSVKTGFSQPQVKFILDTMLELIEESLEAKNDVYIRTLGTFKVKSRAARMGRNPATGSPLKIPPRNVVRFKPAVSLKQQILSTPVD